MKQKLRVGIYGGTFNPPHMAHIKSAKAFIEKMLTLAFEYTSNQARTNYSNLEMY